QRSTVSTIVEELKAEGLIEEIGAGASTGGRRPTLIRLRAAGAMAVGVDITPTVTTVVTSDLVGRVLAREEVENSPRPDEMAARVVGRVREVGAAGECGNMVVGQGGPVACSCGNHDCWEAFASEGAAVARYLKNAGVKEGEPPRACFGEVVERALGGEQAAIDALTETAHYLGIGV